jgi:hypothetical protein
MELRSLSQHDYHLSHRGFCGFPFGSRRESPAKRTGISAGGADDQGMPSLPFHDSAQGKEVRLLHLGIAEQLK